MQVDWREAAEIQRNSSALITITAFSITGLRMYVCQYHYRDRVMERGGSKITSHVQGPDGWEIKLVPTFKVLMGWEVKLLPTLRA